jgi:ribosomal protein S27AE
MAEITKDKPLSSYIMMHGYLAHDNKLFDRACPQCGKGGFYSAVTDVCTKCGSRLECIVTEDGTPMIISEGTFFPIQGDATRKLWEKTIERRRASKPTFRFNIVEFMDMKTKRLQPPKDHYKMVKGALIKLVTQNHLWIPKTFPRRDPNAMSGVEEMFQIFPKYRDTIEVISGPKAAASVVAPSRDPKALAQLIANGELNSAQLAELWAQAKAKEEASATPTVTKTAVPQVVAQPVEVIDQEPDNQSYELSEEDLASIAASMDGFIE